MKKPSQKEKNAKIHPKKSKAVFYWPPRILSILFICFLSMFALDIFGEDYTPIEMLIGFTMHMIPSFALIAITILAWKKELWGGIAFLIIATIFTFFFNTYREIITFLLISGPVFLTGFLFLLSHKKTPR